MTDHELIHLAKIVPPDVTRRAVEEANEAGEFWAGLPEDKLTAARRAAIQVSLIADGALDVLRAEGLRESTDRRPHPLPREAGGL